MKIGSLFSGYGGLDMAVEAATGATPTWFCEWDDAPSKILAHHWPDIPNHRDVTKIDWSTIEPVDIITGGSPCQDLSAAGKRAGMTEGTRSNLWVNMREAIATIRPQLVVWENVQGALSAKATSDSDMEPDSGQVGDGGGDNLRALGRVLGDLTEIGYDAEWTTLRASDIGAPHHRARVFLVAYPTYSRREHGKPWRGDIHREDSPIRAYQAGQSQRHSGDAPNPRSIRPQEGHVIPSRHEEEISITDRGGKTLPDTQDYGHERPRETRKRWTRSEDCHNRAIEWGEYAPAIRRWEHTFGVAAPNPTIPNSRGNPQLSATFAEWMMGLTAGHVTSPEIGLTRAQQLKAIGNGVMPQQAEAALRHLLDL